MLAIYAISGNHWSSFKEHILSKVGNSEASEWSKNLFSIPIRDSSYKGRSNLVFYTLCLK